MSPPAVLEVVHLQGLFAALARRGYRLIGPTVRDGAIVYDEVSTVADLPGGWTDVQDGGTYRLRRRNDNALFGYVVGPHAWKQFLLPAELRLWQAERQDGQLHITETAADAPRFAFIGVRACDLQAIAIQDTICMRGPYADPVYTRRRQQAFVVAVNCGQAGGTCFCVSMGSGPRARHGFDLALTEVLETDQHYFVLEVGSERGAEVVQEVPHTTAGGAEEETVQRLVARAAAHMGRVLETAGINELLSRHPDHPRWEEVATRCLACANCTMVCPTCFCTAVEDATDLSGERAIRQRRWDSCFTQGFSYIHGGSIRPSTRACYRQWLTHKLASWLEQFGTSGCVGCGRCITWCPVAIDITEEVRAIRESTGAVSVGEKETSDGDA